MSRLKTTLILIIFAICVPVKMVRGADASGQDIGVIYPEVREPYASIFASMLDGIYEAKGDGVHYVAVRKE